jgi:hypothetical protein
MTRPCLLLGLLLLSYATGCILPVSTGAPLPATTVGQGRFGFAISGEAPTLDLIADNGDNNQTGSPSAISYGAAPAAAMTMTVSYGVGDDTCGSGDFARNRTGEVSIPARMIANAALAADTTPNDSFVAVADTVLARALRQVTADLLEPRVSEPKRALEVLGRVAETLTGFAYGAIVGELVRGVRRWFGDEIATDVQRTITTACGTPLVANGVVYLADAHERPLVNELASVLHLRFCAMSRDVQALVAAVVAKVDRRAPHKQGLVAVMLDLLAKDDTIEQRIATELSFGWQVFVAIVTAKPFPSMDARTARSRALWQAWQEQHAQRTGALRDRDGSQQAGYIMLVA